MFEQVVRRHFVRQPGIAPFCDGEFQERRAFSGTGRAFFVFQDELSLMICSR